MTGVTAAPPAAIRAATSCSSGERSAMTRLAPSCGRGDRHALADALRRAGDDDDFLLEALVRVHASVLAENFS